MDHVIVDTHSRSIRLKTTAPARPYIMPYDKSYGRSGYLKGFDISLLRSRKFGVVVYSHMSSVPEILTSPPKSSVVKRLPGGNQYSSGHAKVISVSAYVKLNICWVLENWIVVLAKRSAES